MSVETHRLERSIIQVAFEAVDRHDRRRQERHEEGLDELREEFQIAVSGTTTSTVTWVEVDIDFNAVFIDAREYRDSPHTEPQFSWGVDQPSGYPAMFAANVRLWKKGADDSITGARVALGVCRPGYPDASAFKATMHLTFAGYGFPYLNEDEVDDSA